MRRVAKIFGVTIAALVLALVGWFGFLHLTGNLHPVVAGEIYRSAQPDAAGLARIRDRHGIASIINLRGENEGALWYDEEIRAAHDMGITHYNFRMSAATELTADEAQQLIALMRDAPKPLLIHCKSGADRTGLAAALYVAGVAGLGETAAEWHLSPRYGHIGIPFLSRAWPMDVTWEAMEPALGFHDS